MRILIKVEGGGAFGLGHVTRSIVLANTLEEMGEHVVRFVSNDDEVSEARLRATGIPYEILETISSSSLRAAVDRASADLLIIDQPTDLRQTICALRQERRNLALAALDPPILDLTAFDMIVNLFYHGTSPRPSAGICGYYEGLEYAIIRPEFLARRNNRNNLRELVRDVLVCFGATDPHRLTLKVLCALEEGLAHEMKLHVVVGPGFTFKEEVREAVRRAPAELKLYEDVQDMARLMDSCDIGIVGGGTTLMEMCCLGCPSVTIAQNQAEMRFARYLSDRGAARNIGMAGQVSEEIIRAALFELGIDWTARKKLARQGQALIDGQGRNRTAALILREFKAKRQSA